ncbi:MAG: hypothetical protein M0030_20305 [Actinomycetota bacterium]|nr:hypothetical protein [Actinomycetota bacterium]
MTIGRAGQPAAAEPAEAGGVLIPAQRPPAGAAAPEPAAVVPADVAPADVVPAASGGADRAAETRPLAGRVLRRADRVLRLAGRALRTATLLLLRAGSWVLRVAGLLLRAFGRVVRVSGRLLQLVGWIGLRAGKGMLAALAAVARWLTAARTWRPVLAAARWLALLAGRGVAALLRLVRAPAAQRRLATAVVQASALAATAVAIDTGQRRGLPGPPPDSAGAPGPPAAPSPEVIDAEPMVPDPAAPVTEPARSRPMRSRRPRTRPAGLSGRGSAAAVRAPVAPAAAVRRPRTSWLARLGAVATWMVVGVTLFICYLHVSRTSAVTSDGASNALQAWDMLHHNPLLRGWQLSDVSFYSTELPEYAAIEYLRGLTPDVVHVASALTYTMIVLLAALLAKGRATGRRAVTRCLIAGGIMLAPQAGNAVYTLMGSPDHMGSAVPVLIAFVLIDRAGRRWYTPIAVALVLAIGLVGDGIIVYTGVGPIAAVGLAQAYQARLAGRARWRTVLPDLAIVAAAVAAVPAASLALGLIRSAGGFRVWPVPAVLASSGSLPGYLALTGHGLAMLFGADFFGQPLGLAAVLAIVHLAGLWLAGWALAAALRRWARAETAVRLLAVGIVLTLTAYVLSTRADNLLSSRDITAVLPFGAALAGRALAGRLERARLLPALAVVLAGYLISLGQLVTRPAAVQPDAGLAAWLGAHHLTYGLAGYWDANITTLQTGGQIRLLSVLADGSTISTDYWEMRTDWYQPARHVANFIVLVPSPPGFKRYPNVASVRATFGQPLRIYYLGRFTIMVWNKNLLASLAPGGPLPPRQPAPEPTTQPIPAPSAQ